MPDAARSRAVLDEAYRLAESGMPEAAIDLCRGAARDADADLLAYLAALEQSAGLYAESRKHSARAYDLSPSAVTARDLAWAYVFDRRPSDAHRVLDRALRRWPDDDVLIGAKAELLHHAGESDAALVLLEPAIGREPNDPSVPIAFSFVAAARGMSDRAIDLLRSAIARGDFDQELRTYMRFRVGALLDKTGRYDEAWAEIERANGEVQTGFDPARFEEAVDQLIRDWDEAKVASNLPPTMHAKRPVFIVGMPRSGTSLAEQILGVHPRVFAAGETSMLSRALHALADHQGTGLTSVSLSVEQVNAVGMALDEGYRELAPRAERITDKMPENIMHMGMISAVLPDARVVVCRRDPLDVCLSCYFQHFRGGLDFAYDLSHLGRYARALGRLSDHWVRVLPTPIYELSYERLVADQEGVTRELLEFVGVGWDERCLRFHEVDRLVLTASVEQVRRPMNSASVGRWRHYEPHLGPLRAALGL